MRQGGTEVTIKESDTVSARIIQQDSRRISLVRTARSIVRFARLEHIRCFIYRLTLIRDFTMRRLENSSKNSHL
jgi:hypothetical protein